MTGGCKCRLGIDTQQAAQEAASAHCALRPERSYEARRAGKQTVSNRPQVLTCQPFVSHSHQHWYFSPHSNTYSHTHSNDERAQCCPLWQFHHNTFIQQTSIWQTDNTTILCKVKASKIVLFLVCSIDFAGLFITIIIAIVHQHATKDSQQLPIGRLSILGQWL